MPDSHLGSTFESVGGTTLQGILRVSTASGKCHPCTLWARKVKHGGTYEIAAWGEQKLAEGVTSILNHKGIVHTFSVRAVVSFSFSQQATSFEGSPLREERCEVTEKDQVLIALAIHFVINGLGLSSGNLNDKIQLFCRDNGLDSKAKIVGFVLSNQTCLELVIRDFLSNSSYKAGVRSSFNRVYRFLFDNQYVSGEYPFTKEPSLDSRFSEVGGSSCASTDLPTSSVAVSENSYEDLGSTTPRISGMPALQRIASSDESPLVATPHEFRSAEDVAVGLGTPPEFRVK
jgi:hypothetical protein